MTLPTSGSLSLSDVLAELRVANPSRTAPISLGDADVVALAGRSAPVSLSDLYGKSSYVPMTVTPHDGLVGNFDSDLSSGTATAFPFVTVTGGQGGYSYAWSILAQNIIVTLSNANTARCTISRGFARYSSGEFDITLRCVVTDGTGRSVTVDGITAYASWGNLA